MPNNAGRVTFLLKGDYLPGEAYERLDVVFFNGKSYACKQASIGNSPTNTTYWQPMTDPTNGFEVTVMPVPGPEYLRQVCIYIGITTADYTSGQIYQCLYDTDTDTYSWNPTTIAGIGDTTPTIGSTHWVTSDGIARAIDNASHESETDCVLKSGFTSGTVRKGTENGLKTYTETSSDGRYIKTQWANATTIVRTLYNADDEMVKAVTYTKTSAGWNLTETLPSEP